MEDKTLRQTIIDELEFEPSIDSAHIGVAVEAGVVTLTGHVANFAQKIAVEDAVRRVRGVKAIAQDIEVRYPNAKRTSDDEIAKRALAILAWDVSVPDDRMGAKVQQGWITLSGDVDWYYQKQAAENAIRKLTGVVGVTNVIGLTPSAQPADVKKRSRTLSSAARRRKAATSGFPCRTAPSPSRAR